MTATEEQKLALTDKLVRFYESDYVAHNRPEVRAVPITDWLQRQFRRLGMEPGLEGRLPQ